MHLSMINEALEHKISGGSDYYWECYGENARFLDYESDYGHASIIFDTQTQIVYEGTVEQKSKTIDKIYRWINPSYLDSYKKEENEKDISSLDIKYIDLEVDQDFLTKAKAIMKGEWFDDRVTVPIDLSDEEFIILAKKAHERDITINKMVEHILLKVIEQEENKN